jgi:hypothetical protein
LTPEGESRPGPSRRKARSPGLKSGLYRKVGTHAHIGSAGRKAGTRGWTQATPQGKMPGQRASRQVARPGLARESGPQAARSRARPANGSADREVGTQAQPVSRPQGLVPVASAPEAARSKARERAGSRTARPGPGREHARNRKVEGTGASRSADRKVGISPQARFRPQGPGHGSGRVRRPQGRSLFASKPQAARSKGSERAGSQVARPDLAASVSEVARLKAREREGPRPQGRAWSRARPKPQGRGRAGERVCRLRGRDLIASKLEAARSKGSERAGSQTEVWMRQPSGSRSQGRRPGAAELQAVRSPQGGDRFEVARPRASSSRTAATRSRPGRNVGGEAARPSTRAKSGPPGRKVDGAGPRSH